MLGRIMEKRSLLEVVNLWALSVLLVLVPCGSQPLAKDPASQGGSQTVIRATTRIVQVNAVVETRKGEPVANLAKSDFELFDNGKLQQISFFAVESDRPAEASPAAKPLPANVFSNRGEANGSGPGSVTIILLDALNTHFDDQVHAREQVSRFLRQLRPQDHAALYTLGANLRVLQDFTNDSAALLEAISRFQSHESPQASGSEPPPPPKSLVIITPNTGNAPNAQAGSTSILVGLEDYVHEAAQQSADFYSMDRTLRTMDALKAIANRVARIPGRKSLIWVSASFPFTVGMGVANRANVTRGQRSFGPELERAEQVLNDANLAVYPVDARGLMGTFTAQAMAGATASAEARRPDSPSIQGMGEVTPTSDTMEELAGETGGRAFYGSNDILGSVRRALDDSRVTYALAYYPSELKWDGSFHEIKVKVNRGGVRVLARRGYFANAQKPASSNERGDELRNAALSPLDSTAVGLIVRATAEPASHLVLDLTVVVDPLTLNFAEKEARRLGGVDLLFAQLGREGEMLKGLDQPINLRLTSEEYQQVVKDGLSISGRLQLVAGANRLRVVARDANSGVLGSTTIPLDQLLAQRRD